MTQPSWVDKYTRPAYSRTELALMWFMWLLPLGAGVGMSYVTITLLSFYTPHSYTLNWWGVVLMVASALLGKAMVRFVSFDFPGMAGLYGGITGGPGGAAFLYFALSTPPQLHWQIMAISVAALVAALIGSLGERLLFGPRD